MTEDELTVQRLEARLRANEVRKLRSADKKLIARGRMSAPVILRDLPDHWRSARLVDLLMAIPAVGRKRALMWCRLEDPPISLQTRLSQLTTRQRSMLAEVIDIWQERVQALRNRRAA